MSCAAPSVQAHYGVEGIQIQGAAHPVGQPVELLLAVLLHRDERGTFGADALSFAQKFHEFFGQFAGVKEAVQIGAENIALHTAFGVAVGLGAEGEALHLGAAGVDLIARQRGPGKRPGCGGGVGLGAAFLRSKDGAGGQQTQPAQGLRTAALAAHGVGQRFAQHLIPAADAEDRGAPRSQLEQGRFQTGLPQPEQVVDGVLGAGQQDQVGCAEGARVLYIPHTEQRVLFQRHEIGEVRDVGQPDDGEVQRLDRFVGIQPFGERILVLDVHLQIGHDAQHRQMGLLFQHGKTGAQDLDVAPEFVDDEPLDAGAFVRFQQRYGAVQLGKNAAPVAVAATALQRQASVIVISSSAYREARGNHSTIGSLWQLVDRVIMIDNHVPCGDAAIEAGNCPMGPLSTLAGSFLVHSLSALAVEQLAGRGIMPPVFLSSNAPGGREHNEALLNLPGMREKFMLP